MRTAFKTLLAATALAGAATVASAPANADGFGISFGPGGGVSFSVSTGGYCDRWGCPDDYWGYPVYYGPVFWHGSWFNGPLYYRYSGGTYWYWLHGGWRRDEWRGPRPGWWRNDYRYGPALGLDYYHDHGFHVRDRDWDRYRHNHPEWNRGGDHHDWDHGRDNDHGDRRFDGGNNDHRFDGGNNDRRDYGHDNDHGDRNGFDRNGFHGGNDGHADHENLRSGQPDQHGDQRVPHTDVQQASPNQPVQHDHMQPQAGQQNDHPDRQDAHQRHNGQNDDDNNDQHGHHNH